MDKLSVMQAFCRIVDRGSFARAAEDLGVSSALLSRELRLLEDSLGTTLITRTTRSMSLTQAGRVYYDEAKDILGVANDNDVIDAAIISSAQAVEHYEITRYGTLVAFAKQLGRQDCASVLQQTLDEEHAADRKLTAIAESRVNRKAA